MSKQKVSVTLSPERLHRARAVSSRANLSELIDDALEALVERELEQRWLEGQQRMPVGDGLPGEIPVDLAELPWDDDG